MEILSGGFEPGMDEVLFGINRSIEDDSAMQDSL